MSKTEVKLGSGTAASVDLLSDGDTSSKTSSFSTSLGVCLMSSLASDLFSGINDSLIEGSEGVGCCFPFLDGDGDLARFCNYMLSCKQFEINNTSSMKLINLIKYVPFCPRHRQK